MGNLEEDAFEDIWNGPAYQSFRRRTLSRRGTARLATKYSCDFCCFAEKNMKIHQYFRWLSPIQILGTLAKMDNRSHKSQI